MTDLKWHRTWPDDGDRDDWIVKDGTSGYCRVYRTHDGRWYWTAARMRSLGSGIEASRDEAMAAAKKRWQEDSLDPEPLRTSEEKPS